MAINEDGLDETIMAFRCDIYLMQLILQEVIGQLPNPQLLLRQLEANIDEMTTNANPKNHLEEECLVRMRARVAQLMQRCGG